jgi:O-acetyl-ADP-ribose deacetylase (regulator of RNase III)
MLMREHEESQGVRFGRTVIDAVVGELIEQPVQALIYPGNTRGVIGAGPASSLRFAGGPDLERETMELAPIDLGDAVATTAGRLQERGIEAILHAVIVPGLGDTPRPTVVLRALDAALALATESRLSTIALPLLGVNAEAPEAERADTVQDLVDVVVKYVRRPGSRIDRVVFVARFEDDRRLLAAAIARARQRSWTSPA